MFAAGLAAGVLLSVVAIVMAFVALSAARARRPRDDDDERVAALEERVARELAAGHGKGTGTAVRLPPDR